MTILFALSIASFCALLWASFSIARHVRAGGHPGVASSKVLSGASGLRDRSQRQAYADLNSQPFAHRYRQAPARSRAKREDVL